MLNFILPIVNMDLLNPMMAQKDVFVHQNDLKTSGIEEIKRTRKVEYRLASRKRKSICYQR